MLKEGQKYDHINAELSKAYFSKTISPKETVKDQPKKQKTVAGKIIFFASLVLLLLIVPASIYIWKNFIPGPGGEEKTKPVILPSGIEKVMSPGNTYSELPSGSTLLYDFEENTEGWEIPAWTFDKSDHVGKKLQKVNETASSGSGCLKLQADFPGGMWTAALIEISHFIDIKDYDFISADIYLPDQCPSGLRAKFIFTVGNDWRFTEMSRSLRLVPGKWTTIAADISNLSRDWKKTAMDSNIKSDVRKIAIRVESGGKPVYSGPIYIDNVRLWKSER